MTDLRQGVLLIAAGRLALLDHIARALVHPDLKHCDHTLRHAQDWCARHGHEWGPVRDWLRRGGGYCDCEVLFNVDPGIEESKAA